MSEDRTLANNPTTGVASDAATLIAMASLAMTLLRLGGAA